MMMNKPLRVADKPFKIMKANTNKKRNFYTQGQQRLARILLAAWLLAIGSPESTLATPKRQMVPATTTSAGDPSLASTPPTPPPGGALELPPDSSGSFWGSSIASTPSIDTAPQRQRPPNLLSRTRDRLASRLWSPRPQEAPRTPAGPVAEGVTEDSSSAAVASSPAAPADTAQDQASALTNKLMSLYQADNKLPKLIEDDDIPEQDIDQYYVRLQAVVQEQAEYAESAAARDKVVGEKRAIKIEEIFDELDKDGEEPIGRVLLLGGAGIGKTTLMHYISHQWARGRLWKGKHDYVFRVRLKELLNDSWKSAYSTDDLDEHPLACFIHHCLRNQRSQLPASKKKAFKLCKAAEVQSLLEDPASQHSVLLLVDGYDEIASKSQEDIIVKEIVDAILEQERVIMTSRPNAADKKLRAAFDRQVESQGLDRAGIDQYIDLQFGEGQSGQDLKGFITKNKQILGMCEVPINTALLCIVWQDPKIREKLQKQAGEDFKLGELYQELVIWLGKRYHQRYHENYQNPQDIRELNETEIFNEKVFQALKHIAYKSFVSEQAGGQAGVLGISGQRVKELAQEKSHGIKLEELQRYGLLRGEGNVDRPLEQTHYFIHLTFQEYLTALCLSEALSQGEGVREVATHLAEHRNEPRYLMTLKFLAGLVSKSNDTALVQRFWEAVSCNVEGVLELGVASKVELLMHLMAQSTTNGGLDTRIPNREKLQKLVDEELVKDLARWQEQLIASGYKSAALVRKLREVIYQEKPEDISALSAALEIGVALGSRVVEEEEQPLARRLEDLLDSSVWQLQALAGAKLAQVLDDTVDPEQASRLLDKLLELYEEANTRQGALAGIQRLERLQADIVVEELNKSIVQGRAGDRDKVLRLAIELAGGSSKQLAKQLSELCQDLLQSTYLEVRESAISLMEALLAIDAGLAPELLEAAKRGTKDQRWQVSTRALAFMKKLVEADASLAPELLEAAKRGFNDQNVRVSYGAFYLMKKLLAIDAGLAHELLEAAKRGSNDSESHVRQLAFSLMEALLAIDAGLAHELLEAAKRGIKDQSIIVSDSALSLMEKLLAIDAGLAQPLLEAAQRGINDQKWEVRSSALVLMGKLLAIDAGLAQPLLEAAQRGINDQKWEVRACAFDLMEKLLAIDAGLAQPLLEAAQRGINDSESNVRRCVLDLMEKLLTIDAGLAPQFLEAAKTIDSDSVVQSSTLSLIEKLLAIDAGLAPQFLEAAKTGVKDSAWHDSDVRYSPFPLIEKLLSIDAGLASQIS